MMPTHTHFGDPLLIDNWRLLFDRTLLPVCVHVVVCLWPQTREHHYKATNPDPTSWRQTVVAVGMSVVHDTILKITCFHLLTERMSAP